MSSKHVCHFSPSLKRMNSCDSKARMDYPLPPTNQVSISSTFYAKLLHAQIPKEQKKTVKLSVFFVLLGSARAKAARRMLMKLTPAKYLSGVNILAN